MRAEPARSATVFADTGMAPVYMPKANTTNAAAVRPPHSADFCRRRAAADGEVAGAG